VVAFLHGGSPFKVWQPDSFRIRLNRRSTFNYCRDILLPRAERAEFSLENEIPSDVQATHNENEIQRTFSGIRDTILEGSDPGPKLKQALSRVRALG
jgi:hypothetical protein